MPSKWTYCITTTRYIVLLNSWGAFLQLPHVKFHTAMRLCTWVRVILFTYATLQHPAPNWMSSSSCGRWQVKHNIPWQSGAQQSVTYTWAHLEQHDSCKIRRIGGCLRLLCRHVACGALSSTPRAARIGMHSGSGVGQPCARTPL